VAHTSSRLDASPPLLACLQPPHALGLHSGLGTARVSLFCGPHSGSVVSDLFRPGVPA